MRQLFEFEQFVMCVLAASLLYVISHVVYFGVQARRYRHNQEFRLALLSAHKKWVKITCWTMGIIILVVEFVIVPHIGRHLSPLLKIHFCLCGAFVVSGIFACIFHGNKWSGHWLLGYLTFILGALVAITGVMVINSL